MCRQWLSALWHVLKWYRLKAAKARRHITVSTTSVIGFLNIFKFIIHFRRIAPTKMLTVKLVGYQTQ